MDYSKILQFKGTWRQYQARVLKNADKYIRDGKIHIVAAPGSGKTTLGIELIGRMGEVALILTPSITIREQWVSRIREAFLADGLKVEDYVSQDLKNPRCITVITYQALHSAMTKYKGIIDESGNTAGSLETDDKLQRESSLEEAVDYSEFDVLTEMKKAKVGLLCLDECHHLRNEWWKALEEFRSALEIPKLIALTATPPYDSTPALWKRYMDMCGEIDEEITVPELVREGSLCPHQDFVYLNYPTEEEIAEIEKFRVRSDAMQKRLMEDGEFLDALMTHRGLQGKMTQEELLAEGDFLPALLVYLNARQVAVPAGLRKFCTFSRVPGLNTEWLERIVQGFLYEDADAYDCDKNYREQLESEIKAEGLIEKRKVSFAATEAIEKMLTSSKGKCNSIQKIVASEYENLREKLRLLILTDYIRKEYEKAVGVEDSQVTALGVLPFFEQIRRQGMNVKLGVLCGTIVIIPADARDALLEAIGDGGKVNFGPVGSLPETEYVKVTAVGDNHFLTSAVTDIFTAGHMQVLIGTKSLLGEGWDSPCINSLILASFVGAYMLSNQMRGRAIRVYKSEPDKTSNIWHLVCMMPQNLGESGASHFAVGAGDEASSADYKLLCRRMDNFLGLHYTEDVIQNGIDRLSILKEPFSKEHVEEINGQMLALARERQKLKERWQTALVDAKTMEIADVTEVPDELVSQSEYRKSKRNLILSCVGVAAGLGISLTPLGWLGGAVALASGVYGVTRIPKTTKLSTPENRLKAAGEGVFFALRAMNLLEDRKCVVKVEAGKEERQTVFLDGGTGHDKLLFAKCMRELFSAVNDQRYLLVKAGSRKDEDSFYCVPECFGKRKEDAEMFYGYLKPYIGQYEVVYTRNERGKALLLEGRMKALADAKERSLNHKMMRTNK